MSQPTIFNQFPNIHAKFLNKLSVPISHRNLAIRKEEEFELIKEKMLNSVNISYNQSARCLQTHSDTFYEVTNPGLQWKWDAMFTSQENLHLMVRVSDCVPILFYAFDDKQKYVGVVHSGREWSKKRISEKVIQELKKRWILPQNMYFWIWPSISQKNYEFGPEVFWYFCEKYINKTATSQYLDVKSCIEDQILSTWVPISNLEIDNTCTFDDENSYSYRQDKWDTGRRMYWVIWISS